MRDILTTTDSINTSDNCWKTHFFASLVFFCLEQQNSPTLAIPECFHGTPSVSVALDISDLPTRQPCLCRQRVALPWAIVRSQWLLHVHGMHYHDTSATLLLSLPSDGNWSQFCSGRRSLLPDSTLWLTTAWTVCYVSAAYKLTYLLSGGPAAAMW